MNAAAPTVNAGSRMCQPITRANCNRDRKTGSNSISVTPGGHCSVRIGAVTNPNLVYRIPGAPVITAA